MDPKQKNVLSLAAALVLVALAWWQFWPPNTKITQGLDIKGGLSVILTAKPAEGQALDAQMMGRAETIITNRVNGLGVSEASVQRQGNDSILVQLPGVKNAEEAQAALKQTGQLEFVEVATITDTETVAALRAGDRDTEGNPIKLKSGTYKPFLTGEVITRASVGTTADPLKQGQITVNLEMNRKGSDIWRETTQRLAPGPANPNGEQVAIVLDGLVQSAPYVQSVIPDGRTEITGSFTPEEAKRLAAVLQAGALPVTLEFSETRVVGPTLGQDSLRQGLYAAMVGLALVGAFMAVYYRGLGVLSWFSIACFASLFLGILAVLSRVGAFALSLPGIAGMVLTIGLAADSSILMFERFREEVRMGKTYRSAARSGTRHAIGTSVDADLVTFVSALAIYLIAIGPVRGFAFTLMLGIACDLTIAILFTRASIVFLSESVVQKAPWLFGMRGGDADV